MSERREATGLTDPQTAAQTLDPETQGLHGNNITQVESSNMDGT